MDYPQNLTASDRYWFDLIQKCRTSGKSDYQWLKDNNIKSPTFYYHVKQLRKKACEIPETAKEVSKPEIQEVVPVLFEKEEVAVSNTSSASTFPETADNLAAIRLQIHGICIEITNSASQIVIQNTLSALQNLC